MSKIFPVLAVLEGLMDSQAPQKEIMSTTLLVGVQHILETTGSLIEQLIVSGFPASNLILTGKSYSTNDQVALELERIGVTLIKDEENIKYGYFSKAFDKKVSRLWDYVENKLKNATQIQNIIVIDDGGRCIKSTPEFIKQNYKVAAIEQTSKGHHLLKETQCDIPVVLVSDSYEKTKLESQFIAEKILDQSLRLGVITNSKKNVCIIGMGNIGSALFKVISSRTRCVVSRLDIKDFNNKFPKFYDERNILVNSADIIFGCSGDDVLKGMRIDCLNGKKDFLSVSSEDIEFRTILRNLRRFKSVTQENEYLELKSGFSELRLWKNGFPVNFDKGRVSVSNEKISLTRGLLLSAVIQALEMFYTNSLQSGFLELDRKRSKEVLRIWKENSGSV